MRSFSGRLAALVRTDLGCAILVCILLLAAYLPSAVLRLSENPVYFVSALTGESRRGVAPGWPWEDPNSGYQTQALGGFAAEQWLQGHVPWWDPYMGVGVPLAAEMQPAALFLPFVLLLHFGNGVILFRIALQMVAGVATFGLLRQLRLGRPASFAGAALYALNGTFAWFADPSMVPVPFLPLFLLGIERALASAKQKRRGGWILISVALAYMLYAGFPETAYIEGLLALAWTLYRTATSPRGIRLRFIGRVIAGGFVGLLIASPLLVPFFEYEHLSAVSHEGYNHIALPKIGLAPLLMPYVFGPLHAFDQLDPSTLLGYSMGNTGGYFGLGMLFLSATALFSGRRLRGLRILLAAWIVVFAARTLAAAWAENLLKFIPAFDLTQVFRYSEATWELSGAVLAAFALDDWRSGMKRWPVLAGLACTLTLAGISLGLSSNIIGLLLHQAVHYWKWLSGSAAWALAVTCGLTALLLRPPDRPYARVLTALVVVDAALLFSTAELSGIRRPKLDLGPVRFLAQHLGLQRMYTFLPIAPNYGSYFRIAEINHNAVPISAKWMQYVNQSLDPAVAPVVFTGYLPDPFTAREEAFRAHLTGFENAGVRYVVTRHGDNPFAGHVLLPIYRSPVADIFELPHPAPYFEAQGGAPCVITTHSRESLQASCTAPATLVRRELDYPGWRAYVNGSRARIRSQSIFEAIDLPAGRSNVSFSYTPTHIGWCYAAMCLGILAIALQFVTARTRQRVHLPIEYQTIR